MTFKEKQYLYDCRKQPWLWSLGDTYRIKDRPRYISAFGGNSAMDTSSHNPLRYSISNVIGDNNNNNNEVCDYSFYSSLIYF